VGVETRHCLTHDSSHASCDAKHNCVEKCGESLGVGVRTNARGSTSTKNAAITTMNHCKGESGQHKYRPRYRFENSSSEGDMYSLDEAPYRAYRESESLGIGVSANARGGTSTKISTSTMINHCKGERGQHNYQPKKEYNNESLVSIRLHWSWSHKLTEPQCILQNWEGTTRGGLQGSVYI
jgi:hypothetical protein